MHWAESHCLVVTTSAISYIMVIGTFIVDVIIIIIIILVKELINKYTKPE